jgi:hypothetical protein
MLLFFLIRLKPVLDIEGPGFPRGATDSAIGLWVVRESFLNGIKGNPSTQFPGKLGRITGNV